MLVTTAFVLGAMGAFLDQSELIDLATLNNLLSGMYADILDVEVVYDGDIIINDNQNDNQNDSKTRNESFQGNFAFRSDSSTHIDIYTRLNDLKYPLQRHILCLANRNKLEELKFRPDQGKPSEMLRTTHGGLPSLFRPKSFFRIFLNPIMYEYISDFGGLRTNNELLYECFGWEEVDGHRCLRIRFVSKGVKDGVPFQRFEFWVDMLRGGTVLKYEEYFKENLWASADDIKLDEISARNEKMIWMPTRGTFKSFLIGRNPASPGVLRFSSQPIVQETYAAVRGTYLINQALPDDRFTIKWESSARSTGLQSARIEYHKMLHAVPTRNARSRVEEVIADANHQATLLEASAPSRERWSVTTIGTFAFAALGVLSLVGALIMRWSRQ